MQRRFAMHGVKEIISEADSLPVEERAYLVSCLLRTLNPPDPDVDSKWIKEAKHRLEELRSGRAKGIPGNQVFTEVQERFNK